MQDLGELVALVCVFLAMGLVAFHLLTHGFKSPARFWRKDTATDRPMIFVFEAGVLSDFSERAGQLIDGTQLNESSWADVRLLLANRIADLPNILLAKDHELARYPRAFDQNAPNIVMETWGALTRVTVYGWEQVQDSILRSERSHSARPDLRSLDTGFPIWKTNREGALYWCNGAYDALHKQMAPYLAKDSLFTVPDTLPESGTFFSSVQGQTEAEQSLFEIHHCTHGKSVIFFAFDATAIQTAENNRRNIVQTLSKTFAQLSVALAIFDQSKRLILFNPALIDLFGFPPYFLMQKPTLQEFFDHMRERRMMPEPHRYREWRKQIASLIASAEGGSYSERWHFSETEVFRVTGRPHPDGAIELLFEDISVEVRSARLFRSRIEKSQATLDHLPEALIVFQPTGDVSVCNQAFKQMWRLDPDISFANFSYRDVFLVWNRAFADERMLDRISAFFNANGPRIPWLDLVEGPQGERLIMDVIPLPDQDTLIRFSLVLEQPETVKKKLSVR